VSAEIVQWIDADGGSTTLDVEWDVSGRFMPPVKFTEQQVPGRPGAILWAQRHDVRDFGLAIWIDQPDDVSLRAALRSMVAKMDPVRGTGKIRVTGPAGDQREISCVYASGLEMSEKLGDSSGIYSQRAAVQFKAHWPYWRDTSAQSWTFGAASGANFLGNPFFPLRVTSSAVATQQSITNDGDVDAWPIWTVNGPGSGIVFRNITTNSWTDLTSVSLVTGQQLIVDTRPGYKTVVINSSGGVITNAFGNLSSTSELWSLTRGLNVIQLQMTSTVSGVSQLNLQFYREYLSV